MTHQFFQANAATDLPLPRLLARVPAGSPSPADDHLDGSLDLNRHLIQHPSATYFVRVSGDSMVEAGIHPGDLLVVDRAVDARNGDVVLAVVAGEVTVKRLRRDRTGVSLLSDNPDYPPIWIRIEHGLEIWGVVTHVIHSLR